MPPVQTEGAKQVLTELAFTWTQAAALSERNSVGPPAPRVWLANENN